MALIITLTVYQDPETIFQALAAGTHGYLVKSVMPDRLLEAIREIPALCRSRDYSRRPPLTCRQPLSPAASHRHSGGSSTRPVPL